MTREEILGAVKAGQSLSDADLRGANLRGADLSDADLRGANLRGANLRGANLAYGRQIVDGSYRSDGHRFVGWVWGGKLMIRAGCRDFEISAGREHWRHRDGTSLGEETTAILDYIERMAKIRALMI
jgi:hypothetical protein